MTVKELYLHAKEYDSEDKQLYVVFRNDENFELEWAENIEEYHCYAEDEDFVIEL